jgi:branched-subunit amino acid ABC-type transport system permease component
MVGLLGYNVGGLFTLVFIMATWLGGLSGAVIAPTVRLSLGMDMEIIIECFIVVIVGGLGNIWGALLGALITGTPSASSLYRSMPWLFCLPWRRSLLFSGPMACLESQDRRGDKTL